TASPSASDARMTRRSRPSSRMRKPAIAVQNAPDIQVKSAKNSTTLAASSGESPFVLRMSSNRNVAKPLVANVSPKNTARRRRRARPSRPGTVMAQSLRRRKLIDPCLAQRLAIECQIAFDVDRLLRFRRHDPKGHAPVAGFGDLLDDDAVYSAAVRRDVRFDRLCSIETVEIPSRVVDHHLLRAVCRLLACYGKVARQRPDRPAARRPARRAHVSGQHVIEAQRLAAIDGLRGHPVRSDVVVNLLVRGDLDEL